MLWLDYERLLKNRSKVISKVDDHLGSKLLKLGFNKKGRVKIRLLQWEQEGQKGLIMMSRKYSIRSVVLRPNRHVSVTELLVTVWGDFRPLASGWTVTAYNVAA